MGIQKDIIEAEVRLKGMSESQRQLVELSSAYGTLAEKNKSLKIRMLELEAEGKKGSDAWKQLREEMKKNTTEMGVLDAKMGVLNSKLKYSEMTHKQLQKAQKDLQRELSRTSKELDPKKWDELNGKMKEVELQMGKTSAGATTAQKWMGNIKNGFKSLLPTIGIAAGIALLKSAFSAIWDLSKVMQGDAVRSSVVLGDQLGYVESQASKLGAKMGLTNREFVAATAATADLLVPLGFTREASAKMATQVTSLAGALNEWTGGQYGVEEVSKRLQKAVLGETDSLKELGIGIRLDSEEYRKSVKQKMEVQKVTQEQAQAMTIMEMLYQKSTDAQTAYAQNGNRILRFQNSLNVWWKTLKESVASYITTTSDQRLLKSADAIIKQGEEVEKTNKHIGSMLTRYEELKKKGKLTREEQVEMNKAIKALADFAPGAITQVDAYGNAMAISAGSIREAMEAQRLLNLEMQKDVASNIKERLVERIADANKSGFNMRGATETLRKGDAYWQQRATDANAVNRTGENITAYTEKTKQGSYLKQFTSEYQQANKDIAQFVLQLQKLGKTNQEIAQEAGVSWQWLDERVKAYMATLPKESAGGGGKGSGNADDTKQYSLNNDEKYLQEKLKIKQRYRSGDIKEEEEYQKALLSLEIKFLQRRLASGKDKGKDKLDLQNELADKLLQQKNPKSSKGYSLNDDEAYIKDLLAIKKKFRDGDITSEEDYQNQLLALEVKYLQLRLATNKDKGKERLDLESTLADKELQLKKNANEAAEKLQKANNKADVDSIQNYFEERQRLYNQDVANLKASYQKQIEAAGNNKDERKRLIAQQKDEEAKLAKAFIDDTLRLLEQLQSTGAIPDLKLIDSILSEDEKEELKKRIKEILDEKSKLTAGGATEEDVKGALKTPDATGKADILGYTADDWQGLLNNLKAGTLGINEMVMGVNVLMSMYQAYGNLMTQIENRQLQNIEKSNTKKRAQLKKQLDSKTITEKQYNDRVAQMDKELDDKKAELQLKQARREKALGIMGAIVNTAVGVTKALDLPWPLNLIMAALVGAMGAVQIATIASTPLPGKASGGYLVQREQDGKYFDAEFQPKKRGFVSKPTVIVGEGDGTEWVANDKAVKNPTIAPILSIFDEAQRNGSIATLDMNRVMAERFSGRASGGSIGGGAIPAPAGVDSTLVDALNKSAKINEMLEQRLRKPIPALVSMTGKEGLNESISRYNDWKEDVNL